MEAQRNVQAVRRKPYCSFTDSTLYVTLCSQR